MMNKKNRKLVAVVTPANETNRPGGTLWQSIGAWLEIRTQEGGLCFGPTPFNTIENAQKQGEAMVAKWGEFGRTPKAPEDFLSVDHVINDAVALRMYKALSVIALNPNIRSVLSNLDPKALQQIHDAIEEYQTSYQEADL